MLNFILPIFYCNKKQYKEKSGTGNLFRVMKMFCILSVLMVSWMYKTVKTHPIKQIRLIIYNYCSVKLIRGKKETNKLARILCLSSLLSFILSCHIHQVSCHLPSAMRSRKKRGEQFTHQTNTWGAPVSSVTPVTDVWMRKLRFGTIKFFIQVPQRVNSRAQFASTV